MSLTDLMSSMDLAVYPQVAMVIFMGVFAGVAWRTYARGGAGAAEAHRRMALLPLEEGRPVPPGDGAAAEREPRR